MTEKEKDKQGNQLTRCAQIQGEIGSGGVKADTSRSAVIVKDESNQIINLNYHSQSSRELVEN